MGIQWHNFSQDQFRFTQKKAHEYLLQKEKELSAFLSQLNIISSIKKSNDSISHARNSDNSQTGETRENSNYNLSKVLCDPYSPKVLSCGEVPSTIRQLPKVKTEGIHKKIEQDEIALLHLHSIPNFKDPSKQIKEKVGLVKKTGPKKISLPQFKQVSKSEHCNVPSQTRGVIQREQLSIVEKTKKAGKEFFSENSLQSISKEGTGIYAPVYKTYLNREETLSKSKSGVFKKRPLITEETPRETTSFLRWPSLSDSVENKVSTPNMGYNEQEFKTRSKIDKSLELQKQWPPLPPLFTPYDNTTMDHSTPYDQLEQLQRRCDWNG